MQQEWQDRPGWQARLRGGLVCAALLSSLAPSAIANEKKAEVEVVHWWITGGSSTALAVIRSRAEKEGYGWNDSALLNGGSGGDEQRRLLAARIAVKRYPDLAQLNGSKLKHYAKDGHLSDLTPLAAREQWAQALPAAIVNDLKYGAKWGGVPITVHRSNWIWANKKIFDALGLRPPTTFAELLVVAEKVRNAGYIPLAHGGQSWQDAILFDNAVLSAGGPAFYRKALIDLDLGALGSPTMVRVFEQMLKLREMTDPNHPGREWNFATEMVIHGRAAMQVMGDWAQSEFLNKGQIPNKDFMCFPYPGTAGRYIYILDVFAAFNVPPERVAAQRAVAGIVMDKAVQVEFARRKGSIPARTDVAVDSLDECSRIAAADFKAAAKSNTLVPRFESEIDDASRAAIFSVATEAFQGGLSAQQATAELVKRVREAKSQAPLKVPVKTR